MVAIDLSKQAIDLSKQQALDPPQKQYNKLILQDI